MVQIDAVLERKLRFAKNDSRDLNGELGFAKRPNHLLASSFESTLPGWP